MYNIYYLSFFFSLEIWYLNGWNRKTVSLKRMWISISEPKLQNRKISLTKFFRYTPSPRVSFLLFCLFFIIIIHFDLKWLTLNFILWPNFERPVENLWPIIELLIFEFSRYSNFINIYFSTNSEIVLCESRNKFRNHQILSPLAHETSSD